MKNHENRQEIPVRHLEIIKSLDSSREIPSLVHVPEGTYLKVENEGRAANFISCPALLIECEGEPIRCLHVIYSELVTAFQRQKFESDIEFSQFDRDIATAKRIRILLAGKTSSNESRTEMLERVVELVQRKNTHPENVRGILVDDNQFQLVITREGVSIWSGKKNLDMM